MAENSKKSVGKEKPAGITEERKKKREAKSLSYQGPMCMLCLERGHRVYQCTAQSPSHVRSTQAYTLLGIKRECKIGNSQDTSTQTMENEENSGDCSSDDSQTVNTKQMRKIGNGGGCSRGYCNMSKKKGCFCSPESSSSDDSSNSLSDISDSSDCGDDSSSVSTSSSG